MIKHCESCGKEFITYQSVLNRGKGKYCSRKCSKPPSVDRKCLICGNEFKIHNSRKNDKKRGKYCSVPCYRKSEKGRIAWNKGRPAPWAIGNRHRLGKSNPNPNKMFGEDNLKWLGDEVGYRALHYWVERRLGKPKKCSFCGIETGKRFHWANKTGNYLRDESDWIRLCPKCHKDYDSTINKL